MKNNSVILFDGICNLCNSSINFVIDRDKNRHFRYGALQSDAGQILLQKHNLSTSDFDTIVLIENDNVYHRSTAALRIAKKLNFPWPLLYIFIIIPPFIRNAIYNLIAKNRYRWFGKQNDCRIPTPELKALFIE